MLTGMACTECGLLRLKWMEEDLLCFGFRGQESERQREVGVGK